MVCIYNRFSENFHAAVHISIANSLNNRYQPTIFHTRILQHILEKLWGNVPINHSSKTDQIHPTPHTGKNLLICIRLQPIVRINKGQELTIG